eukprot:TRINITY_DN57123_c0_g1_i1.p1 TRINITY_DN57123_c0_g1~~TRINITY_DN57123_c0_g1_i1.p1  ORF type:complete len:151 (-),score=15.46 TRINITY_DN57123_c0_g1_i1:365-817(-)
MHLALLVALRFSTAALALRSGFHGELGDNRTAKATGQGAESHVARTMETAYILCCCKDSKCRDDMEDVKTEHRVATLPLKGEFTDVYKRSSSKQGGAATHLERTYHSQYKDEESTECCKLSDYYCRGHMGIFTPYKVSQESRCGDLAIVP